MHKTILFFIKLITKKRILCGFFMLAGPPGFEPGMSISKTDALPLGYGPIILSYRKDI
jgi:hypothetical protein